MGEIIEFDKHEKKDVTQNGIEKLDRKSKRVINYMRSTKQFHSGIIQACMELFLENGSYEKTVEMLDVMEEYETEPEVQEMMERYANDEIEEDDVPYEWMSEMHRIYKIQIRNLCKQLVKSLIQVFDC